MNTRHLRIFVTVCEEGSFSRAATRLGMSQPALSRIVREQEAARRLHLFHRTGRGVKPTRAGRVFHDRAVRILDELSLLEQELAQIHGDVTGDVNVSIPYRVGRIILLPLVKSFGACFPRASIHVFENLNVTTQQLLINGEVDIGIFYLPPKPLNLVYECVGVEELYVVGRADIIGENNNSITMADAAKLPLILQGEQAHYRGFINSMFAAAGYAPKVARDVETVHGMIVFAMEGEGATILPHSSVCEEVDQGLVSQRKIVETAITRQVCMGARSPGTSRLVRDTIPIVRRIVDEHRTIAGWMSSPPVE